MGKTTVTPDQAVHCRCNLTVLACTCEGDVREVLAGHVPEFALVRSQPASNEELSPDQMIVDSSGTIAGGTDLRVLCSLFDLVPPEDRPAVRHSWQQNISAGQSFETEILVGRNRDDAKWHLLEVSVEPDQNGNSADVLAVIVSIDKLVRRHHRLAERTRAVFDTAVDAIITIDEKGVVQTANEAAERMFGYSSVELIGQNVRILMPEPYHSEHDEYLRRYLETGKAAIIGIGRKVVARRRNGAEFPVHLAVSKFAIDNERHFTGIIRDLSDLEQVQQQLLQSERLAAIGQMVTGLAHESRNALQRAQAHLDMLSLDLQQMPEQLDLAQRTKTALQDLHRLYEEVRSYAAPIQLEYRDCDLSAVWQKEWHNLKAANAEITIRLFEDYECAETACEADVHRMEQVFRNILENAIYACSGSGTIHVRSRPDELHGQAAVRVDFEDSGTGLSDEVVKRLFEPFFTTKQKGTGLGMAIVQRIIEAHNGQISVQSSSSVGACIRVILPRKASVRNGVR